MIYTLYICPNRFYVTYYHKKNTLVEEYVCTVHTCVFTDDVC